jgi:hypothetical protein
MENPIKEQIKSIIKSEAWVEIEQILREPMEDYVDGRYEDIAIHILAKKKAEAHINYTINRLKVMCSDDKIKTINYK